MEFTCLVNPTSPTLLLICDKQSKSHIKPFQSIVKVLLPLQLLLPLLPLPQTLQALLLLSSLRPSSPQSASNPNWYPFLLNNENSLLAFNYGQFRTTQCSLNTPPPLALFLFKLG